jgi:hypothetical protein
MTVAAGEVYLDVKGKYEVLYFFKDQNKSWDGHSLSEGFLA